MPSVLFIRMKLRISQVSLVAAVVLGGLLVCWPVATRGAKPAAPAGGNSALAKERFQSSRRSCS